MSCADVFSIHNKHSSDFQEQCISASLDINDINLCAINGQLMPTWRPKSIVFLFLFYFSAIEWRNRQHKVSQVPAVLEFEYWRRAHLTILSSNRFFDWFKNRHGRERRNLLSQVCWHNGLQRRYTSSFQIDMKTMLSSAQRLSQNPRIVYCESTVRHGDQTNV